MIGPIFSSVSCLLLTIIFFAIHLSLRFALFPLGQTIGEAPWGCLSLFLGGERFLSRQTQPTLQLKEKRKHRPRRLSGEESARDCDNGEVFNGKWKSARHKNVAILFHGRVTGEESIAPADFIAPLTTHSAARYVLRASVACAHMLGAARTRRVARAGARWCTTF